MLNSPTLINGSYYLDTAGNYMVGDADGHFITGDDCIPAGEYQLVIVDCMVAEVSLSPGTMLTTSGANLISLTPIEGEGNPAVQSSGFTAEAGTYTAGVDFPAGTYSIEALEGSSASVAIYGTDGRLVQSEMLWHEKGRRIGRIEILDGYTVEVGGGGCRFGEPGGITFD